MAEQSVAPVVALNLMRVGFENVPTYSEPWYTSGEDRIGDPTQVAHTI